MAPTVGEEEYKDLMVEHLLHAHVEMKVFQHFCAIRPARVVQKHHHLTT